MEKQVNKLTKSNRNTVLMVRDTPHPLQPINQRFLQTVRPRVPDLNTPIFCSRDDEREFWVEDGERDVVRVAFKRGYLGLCGDVPYLNGAVIAACDDVGAVCVWVVVNLP